MQSKGKQLAHVMMMLVLVGVVDNNHYIQDRSFVVCSTQRRRRCDDRDVNLPVFGGIRFFSGLPLLFFFFFFFFL